MVDERIASENHPSASDEALARAYRDTPNYQTGAGAPAPTMFGTQLASTEGMTPEAATAEHDRLMRDPAFMARLSGNRKGLDHLERLSEIRFGGGPAAAQKPAGAPQVGEDGQPLTMEQQRAADALSARQAELADPAELRYLDEAAEPRSAMEYTEIGSPGAKGVLLQHGVHPATANFLAAQHGDYAKWDDATFDKRVDAAAALIMKRSDGQQILQDARRYLDSIPDDHPMAKSAGMACAYAVGIQELARLGRRDRTAAH